MAGAITPWRCGVCRKELRQVWAVVTGKPFPVCSECRLMVHHGCLAKNDPPLCRRCADPQPKPAHG